MVLTDAVPDEDAFRALARSSPWRWTTAQLTVRWHGAVAPGDVDAVRAWVRRDPRSVRVESLDGVLVLDEHAEDHGQSRGMLVAVDRSLLGRVGRRARRRAREAAAAELAARAAEPPVYRPDGLVAVRPLFADTDDAMYRDYRWVAMLDPVELADGGDPDGVDPATRPGTAVGALAVVDHRGRPAWEAVVRALPAYQPRCGCCSLLAAPRSRPG
ncbi:hypothetical protein [Georgenia ruanii]|uniref:hypothetical protein n=1 Tax=Georgenia ruanii TaxID=348442 RepID=UPI001264EDCC|nr:hypothetical protein [Georgenia ruanii]